MQRAPAEAFKKSVLRPAEALEHQKPALPWQPRREAAAVRLSLPQPAQEQ
jgi:hypothetical protein